MSEETNTRLKLMQFALDASQQAMFDAWQRECDAKLTAEGKSLNVGAIGGRFTFSFTPTSLGEVVKVHDELTNAQIDLTDYGNW